MEHNGALPARIFLRPIGSPLTIAMSGLAIASLVQGGFDLNWTAPSQVHAVGLILIAAPFLLQFLASVLAYLSRDGAAGAAIGVLSVSWLALGLVHLTAHPGSRSGGLGLMLLAAGGVLILSSVAVARRKPLPGVVFVLAGIRFVLSGVHQLGASSAWVHAAGIVSLVVLALASYCVLAFELEGEQHRPVLPTFRRGPEANAEASGPAEAIGGVIAEAGVRHST